jgi:hypothetical protein
MGAGATSPSSLFCVFSLLFFVSSWLRGFLSQEIRVHLRYLRFLFWAGGGPVPGSLFPVP